MRVSSWTLTSKVQMHHPVLSSAICASVNGHWISLQYIMQNLLIKHCLQWCLHSYIHNIYKQLHVLWMMCFLFFSKLDKKMCRKHFFYTVPSMTLQIEKITNIFHGIWNRPQSVNLCNLPCSFATLLFEKNNINFFFGHIWLCSWMGK